MASTLETLDSSHISLIKGWSTFTKMKRCEQEINQYLEQVVDAVIGDLKRSCGFPLIVRKDFFRKEYWFDAYPEKLGQFAGLGMRFGLGGITPEGLTSSTAEEP